MLARFVNLGSFEGGGFRVVLNAEASASSYCDPMRSLGLPGGVERAGTAVAYPKPWRLG